MTDILLIRHGANDWVGDRLAGWTPGVHLNDQGRQQAAAVAERLADWPIVAVYSSPLERAVETAEPLALRHNLPVTLVDGLGESRYGDWTGQPLKELAKQPEWLQVQFTPSTARFPGGESLGEMQARVVAVLEKARAAHPKGAVAVFSHADIIKAAVAYYAGVHLDLFQRLVVDVTSVSWIRFTPHGPRLMRFNDTGALEPPKSEDETRAPVEEAGTAPPETAAAIA